MKIRRWILAAVLLGAASGCEQATFPERREEAQERWLLARARVLYRVADNRLAAGELDAAAKAAGQALALQPDYLDAKLLLCRVLIEQGRYAPAANELKQTMAAEPQDARVPYLLGVAQEKIGQLEDALASFRRAHAMDESNLAAVKAAAEVLVALGQTRRAQLYIESFLPKAGEDAGVYELAGRLAVMGQEYDKAAEHYERARDLDYKNLRYIEALGQAQYAAGRHGVAADTLGELVGREGYDTPVWVYMMLADCRLAQGRAQQAFEAYYTASEQEPDEPQVWLGLARSALAMGDRSRAILAARKALQVQAHYPDAYLLLGYALLRDGQSDQALKTLTRAAAAHPRNGTIRCLLGRAHAAEGNRAEAIRCYTRALELDPDNALARELLDAAGKMALSRADTSP